MRATIRARAEIEQEFELELLFLFEKRAREAASLGAIGHRDSLRWGGGAFFKAIFGFVFKNGAARSLKMAPEMSHKLIKNELETKSTKHVENVPNLIPLDLQETRFRMEKLTKITKTRGADKYKQISKHCVEMRPKSMENRARNSTENDA